MNGADRQDQILMWYSNMGCVEHAASRPKVFVKKLVPQATIPTAASQTAAGLDLTTLKALELNPGARMLVGTGLAMMIPTGYEGQVRPRSGLAFKYGVTVLNAPGTIDADYRGEICVLLINHGPNVVHIEEGDRIAQLVIAPVMHAECVEVAELNETTRGAGGFGSTGR